MVCPDSGNELTAAGEEGTVREFGMDMYTPLYLKRITSKDLPHGTGSSALWYVVAWLGGEFGGQCMAVP